MRMKLAIVVSALVAAGIGWAAPASAGCETQPFARYCDGPIRADGTWDRCFEAAQQPIFGQYGQVTAISPSVGRCYPVDPKAFPQFPLGQPLYHIYP